METDETMFGGGTSSNILAQAIKEGVMSESMSVFTCRPCGTSMTGTIPAESHLKGAKHKKAMQMPKREASTERNCDSYISSDSDVNAAVQSGQVEWYQLGNQMVLTCVPCNKSCSGDIPMMQHLRSEAHAKKMRQEAFNSSLYPPKQRPEVPSSPVTCPDPVLSLDLTEVKVAIRSGQVSSTHLGNQMVLTCRACHKSCTGEVPMMQHLNSDVHIKNVRLESLSSSYSSQSKITSVASASVNQNDNSSSNNSTPSPAHKHTLQQGLPELSVLSPAAVKKEGVNECSVCNIVCNSQGQLATHLQGEPHKKQWRLKQTTLRLRQPELHPEPDGKPVVEPVTAPPESDECSSFIIPPPPQFKDSHEPDTHPTQTVSSKETGGGSMEKSHQSIARNLLLDYGKKPQLSRKCVMVHGIQVYRSNDCLDDLFDEFLD